MGFGVYKWEASQPVCIEAPEIRDHDGGGSFSVVLVM